ncbi:MAG: filamentous hemagglutinin N-terminal domain-containing protein, partial [Gammaproteobacteria bacterium]|nr:filamentous hemagglutinin N-terminal domain-containing protein [Gammaproteobacteria bacterium]
MNKGRHTLLFSDERGTYVPVAEGTRARGKSRGARALRRIVAAMAAALPGLTIANPTGHEVVHGQVGMQTQGSTLNITASDRAIINWKQFSIQPGETTRFIQPGSTATVLNRVVGQDPSQILGNLVANGRVFLINPNGVLFGAGARVDTAGLVASTLNIRNEDFLAGRLKFDAEGAAGRLRNEGTLKTTGGPLILIATDIENTGLITAENGDIVLAAGRSVEIADPHQPALRVKIEAGGEAINLGQLLTQGGNVGMFGAALTQAGKVSATGAQRTADGRIVLRASKSVTLGAQSETIARTAQGDGGSIDIAAPDIVVVAGASVDASGNRGGRIDIAAEKLARVEGTLRATGHLPDPAPVAPAAPDLELPVTAAGPAPAAAPTAQTAPPPADAGRGGDIVVTAEDIAIADTATLDASGDTGGGSVLIGGDWQGANPDVRNARTTWVGNGAGILADALLQGDGGKVVVWADQATAFAGNIWSRGGRNGGDGGHVEVSGKVALLYRGRTDTRAARGRNGELLLDPLAIVLQGGSGDGSNDGTQVFGNGGMLAMDALGPTVIFESELEEQSKTTDIILRAQRSVTVGSNPFSHTASGNLAGETSGQLALAAGSSLLIETRNLGAGEGGASAGIDLVTNGWHGSALQIITQGSGDITLQTGYANGVQVGDQVANLLLPVLRTAAGDILVRAGDDSTVQLVGADYSAGGAIDIVAGTVTGGTAFNAGAGTHITGDYVVSSGTLSFSGGNAAISGLLTLGANLGGNASLSLGGLDWRSGRMNAGGIVTLTGNGVIDSSNSHRYLARELVVAGRLSFENPGNYYLGIDDGGTLRIASTGSLATRDTNGLIYLGAGAAGTARLLADAGSNISVAAGTALLLRSNSNAGNQIAGAFALSGTGAMTLDSGLISTGADTTIGGSGTLALVGGGALGGSHTLTIASGFNWTGGTMGGTGTTVLSGSGAIDNTSNYKYLNRRLDVTGDFTFGNSSSYYLQVGNGGELHIGSTGRLTTTGANGLIYFAGGNGGAARFSADDGAVIEAGADTTLTVRADGSNGNQLAGTFELAGDGVVSFDSGIIELSGATRFDGTGRLRMAGNATFGGAGSLAIASAFEWFGGTLAGSGTATLSGAGVIDNTSSYKYLNRRLDVTGSLTFGNSNGYYVQVGNGGTLHLAAAGVLGTGSTNGLIHMTAGAAGSTRFSADAGARISIADGTTFTLRGDGNAGNQISGDFALTGPGAMVLDSGSLTTAGATRFSGAGPLRMSGVTFTANHATTLDSVLRLESGTLTGSADVIISGPFTWAGGVMSGSGTTVISGAAQIDNTSSYKYLDRRMDVSGSLTFGNSNGYYINIRNGGELHLAAGGTLATQSVNGLIYMSAGTGGTARLSADDGSTLDIADGTVLTLRADSNAGNLMSGTFGLTGAGTLVMDSGVLTTGAATRFDGDGFMRLGSGATFNANHAATFAAALSLGGATLGGSGATTISGPFTWSGGIMNGSGTTVLTGDGVIDNTSAYKYLDRRLEVSGTLSFGNSNGYYVSVRDGGTLHLNAGAQLSAPAVNGVIHLGAGAGGSALLSADDGATINVADGVTFTLRSDNNAGNRIAGNFELTGAGTTHFDSGTISADSATVFDGDGKLLLSSGATLGGSAQVTIASAFDWTGGVMSGTGKTVLVNAVTLSGSGTRTLNRTLEIAATGSLDIGDNVVIQRSTNNGGTGGIVAFGTLTKSAGAGTAYLQYVDLQGNFSATSGTLSLYGNVAGTGLGAASFSSAGTAVVLLDNGLFTLGNGQTANVTGGTLDLASGATLSTAGNASVAGAGTFLISSGVLDGAGTLTIASGFNWTGGSMNGAGVTRLVNAVSLTGNGTRTLNRTLEIATGASLDLGDSVAIQRSTGSGGTGGIVALGALTKSTGSGTAYLRYFDLRGNISAGSGVLSIVGNTAGSSINGAALSSTGSGSLRLDSGTFTLNDGESASVGAGTLDISDATLTTTGNSAINGAGNLLLSSGTINGTGTLTVNSAFDWSTGSVSGNGTLRLAAEARVLSGSTKELSRTLEVAGRLSTRNQSGTLKIQDGGRISVLASGEFAVDGGSSITHAGSGRIDNAGLMRKTGTAAVTLAVPLTNSGTLRIEEGTLTASAFPVNAGTLDVFNGAALNTGVDLQNPGILQGSGTVDIGSGLLTNAGVIRPGGSGAAATLTITGNLAQTSAGTIEADVLGTSAAQQDRLIVSGTVALDGDLVLAPAAGVSFGAQDRYTALSCGADACLSGAFASVNTGGVAGLSATTFSNAISFATGAIASTWISQTSGFWDVATNWAGGLMPTASTDVIIDQPGDLTITIRSTGSPFTVNSLFSNENISVTGGVLTLIDDSVINGLLSVSGGTLNIDTQLDASRLALSGGGTIAGGTLGLSGAQSMLSGGTLSSVDLIVGASGLLVRGGIMTDVVLHKQAAATSSALVTIANGGVLEARGTLTLDGATIRLASTGSGTYLRNTTAGNTTLDINGNGTIEFAGADNANNDITAWQANSTLNIGAGIILSGSQSGATYFGSNGSFAGTAVAATAGK